jgi:adenine-specific DNA-methyltransferase
LAAIDDLIAQIEDEALRDRLRTEVDHLTKAKKFGLVFEEHLPELTPIFSAPVRQGSRVARRDAPLIDVWRVLSVDEGQALCLNQVSGEQRQMPTDDLVVVRRFGEPIFPALTSVDRVQNGPDDAPWHTLIEADNYHALQLLEYLYTGQVDCIYIDPPYNTGARDWKYNNDYVDANDRYRHSKWLAMMRRRLILAKRLLRPDGVLIVTIDDNEVSNLSLMLEQVFPEYLKHQITIVINPGGTYQMNFARVHEYAFYVCPSQTETIIGKPRQQLNNEEYEVWKLRRTGAESAHRHQRPRQFYAIYVDKENLDVLHVGPEIPLHADYSIDSEGQAIPVFPIDGNGVERVWRYGRDTMAKRISEGAIFAKKRKDTIHLYMCSLRRGSQRLKTVWYEGSHSSVGTASTVLVDTILGRNGAFPFPKSLYAVGDAIAAVIRTRPQAVVLDFFAGSGTTLNAVNLLNAADNGNRRCILVTNNEVSEDEAKALTRQGYHPGDTEWEQHGICQSVTWPRSKYTILGRRDDGTELEGDYVTGNTVSKERSRTFRRLGFIDSELLGTAARKKEIVSLIEAIPMSPIKTDMAFFVSDNERHTAAILFDDTQGDAFLDALEEMDHVTHFYIVTRSSKRFQDLRAQITDLLGSIKVQEEEKRPMREGFPTNLEYFKLDFLEKDQVALGRQFRAILPLLWLRAGSVGPRPKLTEEEDSIPAMLLPAKNPFAVLVDETCFADFQAALATRDDLTHVFLITDSEEAFQEMAVQLTAPHVIQLYRDYLENFAINRGDVS